MQLQISGEFPGSAALDPRMFKETYNLRAAESLIGADQVLVLMRCSEAKLNLPCYLLKSRDNSQERIVYGCTKYS